MCTLNSVAQGIGINTTGNAAKDAALLEVGEGTQDVPDTKGLLIPRVNLTDVTVYLPLTGTAVNSLLVYNNATVSGDNGVSPGFYYWDDATSKWIRLATGTVSSPLPDPGIITSDPASTNVCQGQTITYSISPVSGATNYIWTAPAGTIITGNGSTSITATFGSISGDVCVHASNSSSISPTNCLSINVTPSLGSITGLNTVYPKQTSVSYTITGSGSYTWTVPTGATIISGQGTNNIIVDYVCNATSGGTITVSNSCGSISTLLITVTTLTANAGTNVTTSACPPSSIGPASGSGGTTPYTYSWSPSANMTNPNTSSPTPPCSSSATYTVTVTDANGCIATDDMNFTWTTTSPLTLVYIGNTVNWKVPAGISSITIDASGAQGGIGPYGSGGLGGRVQTKLSVTAGEILNINVGGSNGYNGGGNSDIGSRTGGGASVIRQASNLVVVAGGGGGGANSDGGTGGYPSGAAGNNSNGNGGGGGTQSAGGSGGSGYNGGSSGSAGTQINGGNGGSGSNGYAGGGGGGYYGGGGGGGANSGGPAGGGGGSSYSVWAGSPATVFTNGYRSGNGQIMITW